MQHVYIGVDPGKSGGMAWIVKFPDGSHETGARKFSDATEQDVREMFAWFELAWGSGPISAFAMIEQVHAMPGQGVSSMFAFGQHYGGLRMALIAARIPFETVTPQKWQRAMGCLSGGDKNVTKARAQELFPDVRITHAVADALLIAEYCRRVKA